MFMLFMVLCVLWIKTEDRYSYMHKDWNEYFKDSEPNIILQGQSGEKTRESYWNYNNYYVIDCYFSETEGAALFFEINDKEGVKCLIEYSMFVKCKGINTNGGAINFFNQNSEFIAHNLCGVECETSNGGAFIFSKVDNTWQLKNRNFLLDSSTTKSITEVTSHVICYDSGQIHYENINSTQHRTKIGAGIYLDANIGSVKYCSICNNTAVENQVVILYRHTVFDTCNILHNSQLKNESGFIKVFAEGNTIKNSCILNNIGHPVFECAEGASITSINCTLDLNIECLKDYSYAVGNVKIIDTPFITSRFVNKLEFISTGECKVSIDSVDLYSPSNCIYYTENVFYTNYSKFYIDKLSIIFLCRK